MFVLFWSTGTPVLDSGDVSSGFQSQSEFCLIWLYGGECYVHLPRSTPGATSPNLLTASIAVGHFPTCISGGRTWFGYTYYII